MKKIFFCFGALLLLAGSCRCNTESASDHADTLSGGGTAMEGRLETGDSRVKMKAKKNYLLIPSQNHGPEASLAINVKDSNILGENQVIELASERIDYWIPVDISSYKGKRLEVLISPVDKESAYSGTLRQSNDAGYCREERYRPIYHFSPDFGWTNDPNGMVYHDGEYHLAYQANPYGTRHYNMHWGNAVSSDLVHWTDLPFIVSPDSLGAVFSGSAVLDEENSAGFGENALVAMYTSAGRYQRQSIAYSTDGGRTYTKYIGNPVISELSLPDFRDPKMIRYEDRWVVAVAAGDVIAFYGSVDLKEWNKLSEFGRGIGSHAAVWECPDLIELEYGGETKWVLLVSINPGGPNGGSVTQYFVGDFDGREFIADSLPYPLWLDEGTDNYAGVTFANTEGRHIFLGWMSNWFYSQETPFKNFRNAMTIPRDLSLRHDGKHLFLASSPSPEIIAACRDERELEVPAVLSGDYVVTPLLDNNDGAYMIEFTVVPDKGKKLELQLLNSKGEKMRWHFDFTGGILSLDRSESGIVDFEPRFANGNIIAHIVPRGEYKIQLFVDRHSTEMFINDGDVSFTNTMFPTEVYDIARFSTKDEGVTIKDSRIFKIK